MDSKRFLLIHRLHNVAWRTFWNHGQWATAQWNDLPILCIIDPALTQAVSCIRNRLAASSFPMVTGQRPVPSRTLRSGGGFMAWSLLPGIVRLPWLLCKRADAKKISGKVHNSRSPLVPRLSGALGGTSHSLFLSL